MRDYDWRHDATMDDVPVWVITGLTGIMVAAVYIIFVWALNAVWSVVVDVAGSTRAAVAYTLTAGWVVGDLSGRLQGWSRRS